VEIIQTYRLATTCAFVDMRIDPNKYRTIISDFDLAGEVLHPFEPSTCIGARQQGLWWRLEVIHQYEASEMSRLRPPVPVRATSRISEGRGGIGRRTELGLSLKSSEGSDAKQSIDLVMASCLMRVLSRNLRGGRSSANTTRQRAKNAAWRSSKAPCRELRPCAVASSKTRLELRDCIALSYNTNYPRIG
jgi:hypothetical protein